MRCLRSSSGVLAAGAMLLTSASLHGQTPPQQYPPQQYPPQQYPPQQYPPQQYPPQQYPPQQYPPQQYPPQQYPPQQYPPQQYPPQQYPPQQYPPQQYPPQQYPPQQYPPQQYPPQQYPPQQYPPQQYPPQQYPPQQYPPQQYPPQQYPPGDAAPPPAAQRQDEDRHHGFFGRLTAGLGIASVRGDLPPEPGFRPIEDMKHVAPVLGVAGLLGGGFENVSIAAELSYEHLLTRVKEPSRVGFQLFGFGVAGSLYLPEDWFLTAHLRWVSMILFKPDIECFWQCFDGTGGPGLGLTVGKEWYGDGDGGVGIALQGNYARLQGTPQLTYASGLVLLTLTRF
jgi:hypothetical protein